MHSDRRIEDTLSRHPATPRVRASFYSTIEFIPVRVINRHGKPEIVKLLPRAKRWLDRGQELEHAEVSYYIRNRSGKKDSKCTEIMRGG